MFQLYTSIFGGELPVNRAGSKIFEGGPSAQFAVQNCQIRNATAQALSGKDDDKNLCNIQPTTVLRRSIFICLYDHQLPHQTIVSMPFLRLNRRLIL